VHDIIIRRGYTLGLERKDNYVNELIKFLKRGGGEAKRTESMVDRLLLAAMIEARSCERFKVLSTHVDDKELSEFYHELMISEATHYTLFIGLARKYGEGIDVEKRWEEWLAYEGKVIQNYGKGETIHG
jgi:tRNA-(ms[2]io[6]A)-hydroxylase